MDDAEITLLRIAFQVLAAPTARARLSTDDRFKDSAPHTTVIHQ